MIKVDLTGAPGFLDERGVIYKEAEQQARALREGRIDFEGAGWLRLPGEYDKSFSDGIKKAAAKIAGESDALVVIGIGGSYLGARACLDFIKTPNYNILPKKTPDIYFVGTGLSGEHLEQIITLVGSRDFSVNIVSKSGSTIEPSIAFRVFKNLLEAKYGKEGAKGRIYATTDASKGRLRQLADREGYVSFIIPGDIGGRYSVLTSVGLLPAAVAGIDIDEMMAGALEEAQNGGDAAVSYASARQALYRLNKKIEILCSFEPSFRAMGEWWKQLFGESEGKSGTGIFPAFTEFTTDLHSLGQYIQSGERTLLETFVSFDKPRSLIRIPSDKAIEDGLESLAGRELHTVNSAALKATKAAHIDGGVPVIELSAPDMSPYSFGALVYFFELSCAVSALVSRVNPFDQPGVEAYKKNLFSILGLKKEANCSQIF
jgi:glucose-6-phosphate isomerase